MVFIVTVFSGYFSLLIHLRDILITQVQRLITEEMDSEDRELMMVSLKNINITDRETLITKHNVNLQTK